MVYWYLHVVGVAGWWSIMFILKPIAQLCFSNKRKYLEHGDIGVQLYVKTEKLIVCEN
jgi:hypothetical protein